MSLIIIRTFEIFFQFLELLIVADAILSWVMPNKKSKWKDLIRSLVDPILEPFRKLIKRLNINLGPVDISPIVALLFIDLVLRPLVRYLLIMLLVR